MRGFILVYKRGRYFTGRLVAANSAVVETISEPTDSREGLVERLRRAAEHRGLEVIGVL